VGIGGSCHHVPFVILFLYGVVFLLFNSCFDWGNGMMDEEDYGIWDESQE
jgi:hypothetical protein